MFAWSALARVLPVHDLLGGFETGGSRAMQRHRRSSLGGGGALPFGGHSFLLTAYSDEKQKERICHKITQLGGHLLEDVPKPQVLALFHPGSQPDCTSAVLVFVKHNRSVKDRV